MKQLLQIVVIVVVGSVALPGHAQNTIYVDDDAPLGGDGASWNTAFRYLQDAIGAAESGDTVVVAGGTHTPDLDEAGVFTAGDTLSWFDVPAGVAIFGGYAGLANPADPDARDIDLYETVLSGDLAGNDQPGFVNYSDNSAHVVTIVSPGGVVELDGLTVRGGRAQNYATPPVLFGGGVFCESASCALTDCRIVENAGKRGAGIWAKDCWIELTACVIADNTTERAVTGGGITGGIRLDQCNASLTDCQICNNESHERTGVNWSDSSGTIDGCLISGNSEEGIRIASSGGVLVSDCVISDNEGTGVVCSSDGALFSNCTISGNFGAAHGGGIECAGGSPTFVKCTIEDNSVRWNGGGVFCSSRDAAPIFVDCAIQGNTAPDKGGGVYCPSGAGLFSGCVIQGNEASYAGGGIYADDSTARFEFCELVGNTAGVRGGGFHLKKDAALTITSCFVHNNTAPLGGGMSTRGAGLVEYCTFGDNIAQTSIGGGVAATNAGHTFAHCTFQRNSAAGHGGGVSYSQGNTQFDQCVFLENTATVGGGMRLAHVPDVQLADCSFIDNVATETGGGLHCKKHAYDISGCSFENNLAPLGGGVYLEDDVVACVLRESTLIGNQAGSGGGVLSLAQKLSLLNVTLAENAATTAGGGLALLGGRSMVVNSALHANEASTGGGLYSEDAVRLTLANCLMERNSAAGAGGGIGLFRTDGVPGTVVIANSTFSGNSAAQGRSIAADSAAQSHPNPVAVANCIMWNGGDEIASLDGSEIGTTYSDVAGDVTGTGNINADPLFADADGPDDDLATWQDNNYRLVDGSPCVDAGNNRAVPRDSFDLDGDGCVTDRLPRDLAGNRRFRDHPATTDTGVATYQTSITDMGAFEFYSGPIVPSGPCPGDAHCDGGVDQFDGAAFVLALTDASAYSTLYYYCDLLNADCNEDGTVNLFDIDSFVELLTGE